MLAITLALGFTVVRVRGERAREKGADVSERRCVRACVHISCLFGFVDVRVCEPVARFRRGQLIDTRAAQQLDLHSSCRNNRSKSSGAV